MGARWEITYRLAGHTVAETDREEGNTNTDKTKITDSLFTTHSTIENKSTGIKSGNTKTVEFSSNVIKVRFL